MRIANAENNPLNWVSILSAGALDMTHCDFCVRLARDEMRHVIGSSEPDVIIDKDENRGCRKKDRDHMVKIVAMPRTRTTVADLYMFGLDACDEGRPGFVTASVRTVTNGRQVGMRMRS